MQVESREIGDIIELTLEGELSIFFKDDVENELQSQIDKGRYKFVIDLSKVTYMDSSGLSLIILAGNKAREHNTNVKLVSPAPQVKYVIDIARIEELISYYESTKAAIDSFK